MYESIIKTLRAKIHVEVESLIGCSDGVADEERVKGRIEALADIIRMLEARLPENRL